MGGSFFCYARGAHRAGSQAPIVGKVFQGWIDVQEYFDGSPREFFLQREFYQSGFSVYSGKTFFKVSFKVRVLLSGIPLSQYTGSTDGSE